ncbi:sensor domain-containing phosphodiesterase [Chlorogloea sp. CCALA 695]|uniref:sensor domain-containing phosphodiesterase n=1 Tax=Chlorogloea sp. CCALA 695 TaxID=2107693 RepID=UPI000D063511|nr:EAL domain-containing protein [Chlorogloea sp. CCALA 695]PSB27268.1 GGDEF domain-containing protein [Chlorogloea sp. CCALA 695]
MTKVPVYSSSYYLDTVVYTLSLLDSEKRFKLITPVDIPEVESKRTEALLDYEVLDTVSEDSFDALTRLATYICQTPIAAISLTDRKRQWYKSKIGFSSQEEPRDITFCAYTILQKELLVVQDSLTDERFATNPFVIGAPYIRFYAGVPLINLDGLVIGTLCVLDHVPRDLSSEQQEALRIVALQVVTQLELRRNLRVLKHSITHRKQSEKLLRHNAFHDKLTNLPNRVLFTERLARALKRTKRQINGLFAVLFIDLDRFKVVNDSLGHMVGDQLLIAIARCLESCLRPKDMVARFGGDEFAILLNNIKDVNDAIGVVRRIQEQLKLPFKLNGQEVFTSVSVGIALNTIDYIQPEDILRDADTAMYRAKTLGKARYEVFNSTMHDHVLTLLQLGNSLQRAVERQELRIQYQPIVLIETGKITGFEALVRWQHPDRGLIFPNDFISIAEESGVIIPLGYWVLREACCQMRAWQLQFSDDSLTISVNLSSKQFLQPDLVAQISQVLRETGLNSRCLKLEITESVIMENLESATSMLLQLKDLGCELHMDDFGTGYSSLSYLHRFPFDLLKIDRSFISRMDISDKELEIVRAIITLAHNLNINVIAEGLETAEQLAQLRALRCKYGQGYFFSKAVKREGAEVLIAESISRSV